MNDLLQPSLQADAPPRAIYSTSALFWAAFLGGGVAITILAAMNSARLGRVKKEWFLFVAGIVVTLGAIVFALEYLGDVEFDRESRRNIRLVIRGVGLALFGGYWYLHRTAFRAMETVGSKPLSPWIPVLVSIGVATIATVLTMMLYFGDLG